MALKCFKVTVFVFVIIIFVIGIRVVAPVYKRWEFVVVVIVCSWLHSWLIN